MDAMDIVRKKVTLIGSGSWASTIAKIVGNNVANLPAFDPIVNVYVEGLFNLFRPKHEEITSLYGIKLPDNIAVVPDVTEACSEANVLMFVLPRQYVDDICEQIRGKLVADAVAISIIKGSNHSSTSFEMTSSIIGNSLGINCSALVGAVGNGLAQEIDEQQYCGSTIGCNDASLWPMWKRLFNCNYFEVNCVPNVHTTEICGALKNIIAIGAGIVDGLGYGSNTKAEFIRLGLNEMKCFARLSEETLDENIFSKSCGISNLIATCYSGRDRRIAEEFVRSGKTFEEFEKEVLNGQRLQGRINSSVAYNILSDKGVIEDFPVLSSVYRICYESEEPNHLMRVLQENASFQLRHMVTCTL